jgi:predicted metal-dependent enzyme (double-stranded beta helix superfamily)
MFDLDRFIDDCAAAVKADPTHKTVRPIVERAVSDPTALINTIGEPVAAGVNKLCHRPDLTILNLIWGKRMTLMPHNHNMWAVIGIYTGREDNIFWRRIEDGDCGLEAAGAKSMGAGDVTPLGADIIHSVTNPLNRLTGAIHVYGGDFFAEHRSEWDPENLTEQTYDVDKNLALFEEANRR